jgi:alkanesulfonate monooxygenase SsuD/methylene tetrahydromethanopterin reductase-like flavin-dependent oxidoreductase (luciferase family)
MRFSIFPSVTQPWSEVQAVVRHAEATGWDGAYIADHFVGEGGPRAGSKPEVPGYLESTAALAALAVTTERIRLGAMVFGITYRHPAVLANWAAACDILSGGRTVLGVGAGWQQNEHDQMGIRLGPPGERIDRFVEALVVLRRLLTEDTVTFAGEHYALRAARCDPKPAQARLPILVGGTGNRMLGVVARHADEWNTWSSPASMAERAAVLDRRCEAIGRDPATVVRSTQALFAVIEDDAEADRFVERFAPQPAVAGSPARLAAAFAAWRDAGVDEIVVPDWPLGTGTQRTDAMDALLEVAAGFR